MKKILVITMLIIAIISSLIVPDIASAGESIKLTGNSLADGDLMKDIMISLKPAFVTASGCHGSITAINRRIIGGADVSSASGKLKEQWSISACGKVTPMYVTIELFVDGKSSYKISAKP